MTDNKFILAKVAAALVAAGAMTSAQAAFVSSWDYQVTTIFTQVNTFENGGANSNAIETPRETSWGASGGSIYGPTNTGRSGISINDATGNGSQDTTVDPNQGNVITDSLSSIGLGAWITHHNKAISSSYDTLLTGEIRSSLSLWADPPGGYGGAPTTAGTIDFTVYFAETTNAVPCTAPSPAGNPCNDIFAINFSDAFNKSFVWDGYTYYVSTFPLAAGGGLGTFLPLSAAECARAGAASGCVGFTTIENQDTTVRFGFSVTSKPIEIEVPEPGILALLGSSLFGLAAFRRRRSR